MTQIDTSKQRPFGQGEKIEWNGGMATITVIGRFLSAGNGGYEVSASVDLHYQARQPDGSLACCKVVKTIRAPGVYRMALSPGICWFQVSGPIEAVQSIEASMTEAGAASEKRPTLADRVEALESRTGKAGLDS